MHAQAHVRPVGERDVGQGGPEDVERLGVLPTGLVVVGRADVGRDALPGTEGDAADLDLAGRRPVDGEQRRLAAQALLNGLGQQRAVVAHRLELLGMREEQVEQVARRAVGRLGPGRQQQAEEGVDGLVRELLAVHLGRDQVADDVLGRVGPPVGHHAGEVVAQRLGGGQAAVDVRHQADELDRPALELGEVLLGQAEQARDHPDRELEGQLAHQVGPAVGGEAVDLLVDDRADELGLPAGQGLLAERVGHQVAVAAVLGVVHAEDHVAHHHPDGRRRSRSR